MKRQSVALVAKHNGLKISNFLHVARAFVLKFRLKLERCGGKPYSKKKKKYNIHGVLIPGDNQNLCGKIKMSMVKVPEDQRDPSP